MRRALHPPRILTARGRILSAMAAGKEKAVVLASGREVAISNPGKVYFPEAGITKL